MKVLVVVFAVLTFVAALSVAVASILGPKLAVLLERAPSPRIKSPSWGELPGRHMTLRDNDDWFSAVWNSEGEDGLHFSFHFEGPSVFARFHDAELRAQLADFVEGKSDAVPRGRECPQSRGLVSLPKSTKVSRTVASTRDNAVVRIAWLDYGQANAEKAVMTFTCPDQAFRWAEWTVNVRGKGTTIPESRLLLSELLAAVSPCSSRAWNAPDAGEEEYPSLDHRPPPTRAQDREMRLQTTERLRAELGTWPEGYVGGGTVKSGFITFSTIESDALLESPGQGMGRRSGKLIGLASEIGKIPAVQGSVAFILKGTEAPESFTGRWLAQGMKVTHRGSLKVNGHDGTLVAMEAPMPPALTDGGIKRVFNVSMVLHCQRGPEWWVEWMETDQLADGGHYGPTNEGSILDPNEQQAFFSQLDPCMKQ